jgi:hypothetical protein
LWREKRFNNGQKYTEMMEKWDNREDFDCQWRNGTTGKTLTASGEMGQQGRL